MDWSQQLRKGLAINYLKRCVPNERAYILADGGCPLNQTRFLFRCKFDYHAHFGTSRIERSNHSMQIRGEKGEEVPDLLQNIQFEAVLSRNSIANMAKSG
jgi:hypothetical protein